MLFVGTWTDRKGTPELAQAFASLHRCDPSITLTVAGVGCGAAKVLSAFPAATRANVAVHPTVSRVELYQLLTGADIYVLSSWFEGMPLSLLEAMAAGLPVVASSTCGVRDVLRPANPDADGRRLVDLHDPVALRIEVERLVRDEALREKLGARARRRAASFTWRRWADELEEAYHAWISAVSSDRLPSPWHGCEATDTHQDASLRSVRRPYVLHRPQLRWRRRHVFAVLGLRPAVAEHSQAETAILQQYAAGAHTIVELGVAEGASALELREVMAPDGKLVLVDPYFPGQLRISLARLVARRTVAQSSRGSVAWMRATSRDAAKHWHGNIDFLFIDADHSLEAVRRDWTLWTPYVGLGGHVALHDANVTPGGFTDDRRWITSAAGPVRLANEIRRNVAWALAGEAETTVVFRRRQ